MVEISKNDSWGDRSLVRSFFEKIPVLGFILFGYLTSQNHLKPFFAVQNGEIRYRQPYSSIFLQLEKFSRLICEQYFDRL